MSNYFLINPKEERLNQLREEALNQMKQEFFLMEFDGIKRAVKYFKIIRKKRIGGTSDYYDLALKALEREIPQKPKEIDEDYSYFVCPICDFTVGYSDEKETHKYCLNCGQRIDWS
ncbi:MAG: hypothetical protein ACOX8A_11630 [Thermacetogeniaceae bacterium]|jgi:rubrerythrin